jgi:hypothetical protein
VAARAITRLSEIMYAPSQMNDATSCSSRMTADVSNIITASTKSHSLKNKTMPHKRNCLKLTIFSGQRQNGTSIGRAQYRIDNGPIFACKIAVKSCTLYNTLPNVNVNRATMTFVQYDGPGDSLGLVEASIEAGAYTGADLALALQTSMNTALASTAGASVAVVYNALTRKLEFTFDATYSYYYAQTYQQYFITSPGFTVFWTYSPSTGGTTLQASNFVAGTYRVDEWLRYCSQVLTASGQAEEATAIIRLTNNYYLGDLNVTFESLVPGSVPKPVHCF